MVCLLYLFVLVGCHSVFMQFDRFFDPGLYLQIPHQLSYIMFLADSHSLIMPVSLTSLSSQSLLMLFFKTPLASKLLLAFRSLLYSFIN